MLTKKEKEKRIKELKIIIHKMEKSILEGKKRQDQNYKKNQDLKKENEVHKN